MATQPRPTIETSGPSLPSQHLFISTAHRPHSFPIPQTTGPDSSGATSLCPLHNSGRAITSTFAAPTLSTCSAFCSSEVTQCQFSLWRASPLVAHVPSTTVLWSRSVPVASARVGAQSGSGKSFKNSRRPTGGLQLVSPVISSSAPY